MKFSLINLMLASFQKVSARLTPRPVVQHPEGGAPPLPAMMKIGFPSAAAFCRASHTLGYQSISIQRDSSF
jgi:hypothetical protein